MLNNDSITLVACPTCHKKTPWQQSNPERPFCSARCKLIDLGAWANETYSIPQQTSEEEEIFSEDLTFDENKSYL